MDALKDVLEVARQGGAAGGIIFGLLWWFERKERRELAKDNSTLSTKLVELAIEWKHLLEAMSQRIGVGK